MSNRDPIGLFELEQLMRKYERNWLVLLDYDPRSERIAVSSFGNRPEDKVHAARLADHLLDHVCGGNLANFKSEANFRDLTAAQCKDLIDSLLQFGFVLSTKPDTATLGELRPRLVSLEGRARELLRKVDRTGEPT